MRFASLRYALAFVAAIAIGSVANSRADATTINFSFLSGSTHIADGSFSFANGATGVLGYNDLSAFSVHFNAVNITYDLSFALAAPSFRYFAYDTGLGTFVGGNVLGYTELLGAISSSGFAGYFFNSSSGDVTEYTTNFRAKFDTVTYSNVEAVPGPIVGAGLPGLTLAGGGLLGWWRRRRNADAGAA